MKSRALTDGMFSDTTDDWGTPVDLFSSLSLEFGPFDLDAAASAHNAKCSHYWSKEQNALQQDWLGRVFLNPPYGDPMTQFMAKAAGEVARGNASIVVSVVPCRTDTKFWHRQIMDRATEIRLIEGRLTYTRPDGESASGAIFPSAIVIYTPKGGPAKVVSCDRLGKLRTPTRQCTLEAPV